MSIADRIRSIRIAKGLTQKYVANQCGMADSAIRKYESGKVVPKIETVQKLARALGVSLSELLGIDPAIDSPENRSVVDSGINALIDTMQVFEKGAKRKPTVQEVSDHFLTPPSNEDLLLMAFDSLNEKGKKVAIERVQELTKISEYQGTSSDIDASVRLLHPEAAPESKTSSDTK